MAFKLGDRVRETSTAPGTGSFTVNGAVQGAQSWASILTANGDTSWYNATNGTAWETGLLTRTSSSVYSRTEIFESSNGGSIVNFASGLVDLYLDLPASRLSTSPIVILATGQSNPGLYPANVSTFAPNAHLWNWDQVDTHVGTAFAALNPATMNVIDQFASDVAKANPTRQVYVINISIGGQRIDQWLSGASAPDMYANITRNITPALAAIGVTKIDLMMWWQGENEYATIVPATYMANYETMMARFWGETWFPRSTPLIIFGLCQGSVAAIPAFDTISNTLQAVAGADRGLRMFVNTNTIPASYWNPPHMFASGYELAGRMAANQYLYGFKATSAPGVITDPVTNGVAIGGIPSAVRQTVNANAMPNPPVATGATRQAIGVDANYCIDAIDAYATAGFAWTKGRKARGTAASPTAAQSGDPICFLSAHGYGATDFAVSGAQIAFFATENFTDSAQGTKIVLAPIRAGTTSPGAVISLEEDVAILPLGKLKFPAAQNASSDVNTLDDYEEGTWTPANANVTLTVSYATYTKIGRQVTVHFRVTWPATADTNSATITGLPFACGTAAGSGSIGFNSSATAMTIVVDAGLSTIQLFNAATNAVRTNANMTGALLFGSVTYNV